MPEHPTQDRVRGSRKPSGHNKGLTVKSPPRPVLEARRPLQPRHSLEPQPAVAGFSLSRVSRLPPTSRERRLGGRVFPLTRQAGAGGRDSRPGHLRPRSPGRPIPRNRARPPAAACLLGETGSSRGLLPAGEAPHRGFGGGFQTAAARAPPPALLREAG